MIRRRLFIIDDDKNMREGLEAFLSLDFDVQCFESAKSFLAATASITPPDCILLDLRMPELNGFDLQLELNKTGYSAPIIFMSGDADKADVITAWREGAVDFVLKPFSAEDIHYSIKRLLDQNLVDADSNIDEMTKHIDLPITRREAEVLLLLGQGCRQMEVAQRLNITLRTVKMYRGFLKEKLNLKSAVELARFYDQHKKALERKIQAAK